MTSSARRVGSIARARQLRAPIQIVRGGRSSELYRARTAGQISSTPGNRLRAEFSLHGLPALNCLIHATRPLSRLRSRPARLAARGPDPDRVFPLPGVAETPRSRQVDTVSAHAERDPPHRHVRTSSHLKTASWRLRFRSASTGRVLARVSGRRPRAHAHLRRPGCRAADLTATGRLAARIPAARSRHGRSRHADHAASALLAMADRRAGAARSEPQTRSRLALEFGRRRSARGSVDHDDLLRRAGDGPEVWRVVDLLTPTARDRARHVLGCVSEEPSPTAGGRRSSANLRSASVLVATSAADARGSCATWTAWTRAVRSSDEAAGPRSRSGVHLGDSRASTRGSAGAAFDARAQQRNS